MKDGGRHQTQTRTQPADTVCKLRVWIPKDLDFCPIVVQPFLNRDEESGVETEPEPSRYKLRIWVPKDQPEGEMSRVKEEARKVLDLSNG